MLAHQGHDALDDTMQAHVPGRGARQSFQDSLRKQTPMCLYVSAYACVCLCQTHTRTHARTHAHTHTHTHTHARPASFFTPPCRSLPFVRTQRPLMAQVFAVLTSAITLMRCSLLAKWWRTRIRTCGLPSHSTQHTREHM